MKYGSRTIVTFLKHPKSTGLSFCIVFACLYRYRLHKYDEAVLVGEHCKVLMSSVM